MNSRIILNFYIMLISPIFGIISGFINTSYQYKRWVIILGITLYGSTIDINESNDGFRHWQNVYVHYVGLGFAQFWQELIAILNFAPLQTNDDVYIHLLSYFLGGVIGMPQLFFVFVSFVYAYFFSGAILKILRVIPQNKLSFLFYAFAIIFILFKNIEGINTVRTWTGLWVLFYAALSYFETKKKKYLFLMFVPPLIHIAYFIMAFPTWVVAIFGTRFKKIYVGIFFASFIFGLNQNSIIENLGKTELGKSKARAYYVEDVDEYRQSKRNENRTWYVSLSRDLMEFPINIIIFSLILGGVYFKGMNNLETSLFSIGILTKALANLTVFMLALHNRAGLIASVFILATLVLLLKRNFFNQNNIKHPHLFQFLLIISVILYIPFIIYKIADLIYFISFFMIALPFIPWFFKDLNLSIREFLGLFL